jgi:hypothetical protein
MPLSKHRDEREVYAVTFAAEMAVDEAIADAVVQVLAGSVDVTAEFRAGQGDPIVDGHEVRIWMKAAAAGEQQRRLVHRLYVRVTTSAGRILVATDAAGNLPEIAMAG